MYKCRRPLFTLNQHKFNCGICCFVQWTSLVFLDAACYPDVAVYIPNEGSDASNSCCANSLSVTTFDLKYDVTFVTIV